MNEYLRITVNHDYYGNVRARVERINGKLLFDVFASATIALHSLAEFLTAFAEANK